jgi:protein TonB
MSTVLPVPATRQAGVLTAIAALHVGAFVLVSTGVTIGTGRVDPGPLLIRSLPPVPKPRNEVRPEPAGAPEYVSDPVPEPKLFIEIIDEDPKAAPREGASGDGGTVSAAPVPAFQGPAIRTRDARLQALIESCYPASARRLAQEGRGAVAVLVDASGRAATWSVDQSTGFPALDSAMGCIARRLQFEPGRLDGRAVEATARMPIHFKLR